MKSTPHNPASPYVYKVTAVDRSLAQHWFESAAPFGITEAEWELWEQPGNDPDLAPDLCLSTWERDECVYMVGAPKVAGSSSWEIWFIDCDSNWIDWGSFPSLGAALNRVRPCLSSSAATVQ